MIRSRSSLKATVFFLLTIILVFPNTIQIYAQSLNIKYISTLPVIDGLPDQVWDSLEYNEISINNQGVVSSGTDLTGNFKIAWTNDSIYLFVAVKDDVIHSDVEATISNDDGLEIFFDIGNDKPSSYEADDFRYQVRYNDAVIRESAHSQTSNVELGQTVSNDTVFYELVFPMSTLSLTNAINDLPLGFDIHINDDDNNGSRDGKLAWFTPYNISSPAYFGTVKLSGKPEAPKATKPNFSNKRGFYQDPFTLSVSSDLPSAQIYYTLDGSNPIFSDTRVESASPASIDINPASSTNRGGTTPGVVVRAAAIASGYSVSIIATHTYIFIDDVKTQTDPNGMWSDPFLDYTWPPIFNNPQCMGYDMNTVQTLSTTYGDLMDNALLDIPSYSIVTEYDDMFDPSSGIYMNALKDGWERAVSLELINPNGDDDFQINAAIRMRGRYSRLPRNPKHSFRILFKESYGASKLNYSVFGNDGLDEYDHLDFRTAQNSSWQGGEDHSTVTFLKEIYARDVQTEMGWDHTRSYYCHLYLNGMYWGLYQIQERADRKFAEDYMGYDENDYDIVKPQKNVIDPPNDLIIGVSDGTLDAASRLWDAMLAGFDDNESYFQIQGMNADGSPNVSYERLLDVESLIDYLLIAFYTGSEDGPGVTWNDAYTGWGPTIRPNNFIGIYNRNNPDGFKWIVHDMEKSMYGVNDDDYTIGYSDSWYSNDFRFFNPLTIHRELLDNEEYRIVFADRVYKYFNDNGLLSPQKVHDMISNRKSQIDYAVIAETARWSWWVTYWYNFNSAPTKARWESNVNSLFNDYIPYRTDIVLSQFEAFGINLDVDPPVLLEFGQPIIGESETIDAGNRLDFVNPNSGGTIYYTTDGSDPRAIGGDIATGAVSAQSNDQVQINDGIEFKARVLNGSTWSPLYEVQLNVVKEFPFLQVTEVSYNPKPDSTERTGYLEFIELKNIGSIPLDLSDFAFVNGIQYQFGAFTLQPNEFVVLASHVDSFNLRYGFMPNGQYTGRLNNNGESVELHDAQGSIVLDFSYSDNSSWPPLADGLGYSIVPETSVTGYTPGDAMYWRSSTNVHGSPNADDPELTILPIEISEALTNITYPQVDQIELYNPNDTPVEIGNWYLSDSRKEPLKWKIPVGTQIPANGYLVFNDWHYVVDVFEYDEDEYGTGFSLSSQGDAVCLTSANAEGTITGHSTCKSFGAAEADISFGTHINSIGESFFVAQEYNSFEAVNGNPKIGPVIISEIMYHPVDSLYEYLKLENITSENISFWSAESPEYTWNIEGVDFKFPANFTLAAGDSVYIIQKGISEANFKTGYGITQDITIFNMQGALSNGGEKIALIKPGLMYSSNRVVTPADILIEEVRYNDKAPWAVAADGYGYSLVRTSNSSFANDPASWSIKLGISNIEEEESLTVDDVSIYPNPTADGITILVNYVPGTNLVISDIFGRIVQRTELTGSYSYLDISNYQSGVYIFYISNKLGTVTKRIIKN